MRQLLGSAWFSVLALAAACSSSPIDDEAPQNEAGAGQGSAGEPSGAAGETGVLPTPSESQCQSALKQSLSLVDQASSAKVATLSETSGEARLYVDATAGGINGADENPWVYVSLSTLGPVALTDLEALESKAWDLAFKRYLVRTNGGDSGPGLGGALRVALDWADVDESTLGNVELPTEDWFDDECNLEIDENGELITTYSGWSQYDEAQHVLAPAPVVFITAAADGALYKVAIEDYYATPTGGHGTVAGRYLVRVASLP